MLIRVALVPGALVAGLLLGGCADSGGQSLAYTDHCRATLGRLVKPNDHVLVLDTRSTVERRDEADLILVDMDFELNGAPRTMRCSYPRRDGAMTTVAAREVAVDGEPISEADVQALNAVVGRADRPMDRIRRGIPNPNLFRRQR